MPCARRGISRLGNPRTVPQRKTASPARRRRYSSGEKYIAAIAFDGDSIGKWVNGNFLPDKTKLKQHHADFSAALSDFALDRVSKIVEKMVDGTDEKGHPIKIPLGQLIYAGGDDVVCLVPADAALEVAAKLRDAFRDATKGTDSTTEKPDASAGIAIAHIHAPLQDLIREAQKAEKRAKNDVGRPALSVTLLKRSGEISHWGSKWDTGGIEIYRLIADNLKPGGLSAKFPHRVCQLLEPYVTTDKGLSKQTNAPGFDAIPIIQKEFAHAAKRQGSKAIADQLEGPLNSYLNHLGSDPQTLLTSVIGLCTTVAFADRTKPAEKQTTAP